MHSLKFIAGEVGLERLLVAPGFTHAHDVRVHNVDREGIGDAAVHLSNAWNMDLKHFDERLGSLGAILM